jgi:hypothetical protein
MTTTQATHPKAVRGRRVTYAYTNDKRQRPGVITDTKTAINGALLVMVRLDGARSNLHVPADHEHLTYLDEVGPVPELPMGRFHPSTTTLGFDFHYDGVAVCGFEDGDAVAVTDDQPKAEAAVAPYLREVEGIDDQHTVRESIGWMKPRWVVFEWEPEDAECVWLMNPASEGDDQAVHVYYLPA